MEACDACPLRFLAVNDKSPGLEEIFRGRQPLYERLKSEALFILQVGTKKHGIKTHSIVGRVKEVDSFAEKITRKNYGDPFVDMQDLVGCRVVCLFLSDLPKLRETIDEMFVIVDEENKIDANGHDTFGYMSVHYICKLRADHVGPRYEELQGLHFEIQARTILMDAWANVSHYLDYKGEVSIPENLRRDFHALSGLFFVADRHFELFYGESVDSRTKAAAAVERVASGARVTRSLDDVSVNLDTVMAYLVAQYPMRRRAEAGSVSEFVEEIARVGYKSIGQLDYELTRADRAAIVYETKHGPYKSRTGFRDRKYNDVGFARQALAIADPDYATMKYPSDTHGSYRRLMLD